MHAVPRRWLPAGKAGCMSDHAETAEPDCAVETGSSVKRAAIMEPGEAMETTGAKSAAAEPERIVGAVTRPVVVTRPVLGIVTAARSDTTVTRGKGVSGWASRDCSGHARRRSAQHRR